MLVVLNVFVGDRDETVNEHFWRLSVVSAERSSSFYIPLYKWFFASLVKRNTKNFAFLTDPQPLDYFTAGFEKKDKILVLTY